MRRSTKLMVTLGVGGLLLAARSARADSIDVHDLSQDPANGIYQYTVDFDSQANVQDGDGLVITDFPGETSFAFSGALAGQFSLVQTLTSNALNASASVSMSEAGVALANHIEADDPTIENLSFIYGGANAFIGATSSVLTVTTSLRTPPVIDLFGAVDNSAAVGGYYTDAGTITVPTAVPLPATWVSGAILLGLIGLFRLRKNPAGMTPAVRT
jgi:hypothetical protein